MVKNYPKIIVSILVMALSMPNFAMLPGDAEYDGEEFNISATVILPCGNCCSIGWR